MTIIDKLEAATGPDRELDADIVVMLDIRPDWLIGEKGYLWADGEYVRWCDDAIRKGTKGNPCAWPLDELPRFSSSIDAAMTLVPEGWRAAFENGASCDQEPKETEAWIWPFESSYEPDWQMGQETQHGNPDRQVGYARTPALAICIASLKARGAGQ